MRYEFKPSFYRSIKALHPVVYNGFTMSNRCQQNLLGQPRSFRVIYLLYKFGIFDHIISGVQIFNKKYKEHQLIEGKGGLASVAPPAENFDAEIDAMIKEIYAARKKSKTRRITPKI